jgi:hypothetical protein
VGWSPMLQSLLGGLLVPYLASPLYGAGKRLVARAATAPT